MDLETLSEAWNAIWENPQNLYIAVGICLFLLVFLVAFIVRPRIGKSVLAYEDSNGRVEVNRSAINELVQNTCAQIETITKPKVVTSVKKGVPALRIKLKVQGDARMKDIRERLRNHLRTQLMENLGFEKLGSIDILVTAVGNLPVMPFAPQAVAPAVSATPGAASTSSVAAYESSHSRASSYEEPAEPEITFDDPEDTDSEVDEKK